MTATPDYFFLDGQKLVATDNGDGTKTLVVSSTGGSGSGAAGTPVVDNAGVRWLWVYDAAAGTSAYINFTTGSAGSPTFPVTPDADTSVQVSNFPATQPISAASLPLPTGAATTALQTALNEAVGQSADAAATTNEGTFSLIALTKRWLQQITSLTGKLPETLGQKAKSASLSVVVATDQSTLPTQAYMPPVPIAGQGKIATTGTAQALQNLPLKNGIVVTARDENSSAIWVGSSDVTSTDDGTGKGYRLTPGQSISFAVENANSVYLIGPVGQIFYYAGN